MKYYKIFLDEKLIGTTELEKADPPMGVVFGQVNFIHSSSGYEFLKTYCLKNSIEIISDFPDDKLISISHIPALKVINEKGIEIKGTSISIDGMDSDIYDITITGVSYPFFEEEFPNHFKNYCS